MEASLWDLAVLAGGAMACLGAAYFHRRARVAAAELESLKATTTQVREVLRNANVRLWQRDLRTGRADPDILGTSDVPIDASQEDTLYAHVHPDDAPGLREAHAQLFGHQLSQEHLPYYAEFRRLTGQGEYRWVATKGILKRDARGKPTLFAGISLDIHERKLTEAKLRESEERVLRAVSKSSDGPFEADLRTNQLWWAPNVMALLGYGPDEQIKTPDDFHDLLHPDDRDRVVAATQRQFFSDEGVSITEYRLRTKAGGYRWFRGTGSIDRDANGKAYRMIGMVHDIDEAKNYQLALQEANVAAAAASRAKSEFLANMSHEIRTPMNGVIGISDLLLETALEPQQREYAQIIRDSSVALLTIINDILDFSKIEAGKLELEHIALDFRATVEQAAQLIAVQANAKSLSVSTRVDPALPPRVLGDPGRLRQVLLNLLGNAVKFTHRGSITVDVGVVASQSHEIIVRCAVRDTGVGIPADRLAALFEPFTQGDASMTRKYGGTGLGLSIVKHLVKLLGGEVGVTSEEGSGSCFWFTARLGLPDAQLQSQTQTLGQAHAVAEPTLARGLRVLLAEDNVVNQKVAARMLERLGHNVTIAGSGRQAVDQWTRTPFDVILMDCQMPEMDGYQATREIRQRERPDARVPIVALTAHAMKGAEDECLLAGMDAYVSKPIDRAKLVATLAAVLPQASADETRSSAHEQAG